MDALLRGQKPVEMIPFSLEGPVVYFPIRHHSPACAWHLEQIIEAYGPDCILVEGPENANNLIPVLTDPESKAPLALHYTYRDDRGLLGEKGETYSCYYPFLDHSPELVALRAAAERQIPGEFMDLPYARILLATKEARGLRSEAEKQNYASDRYLANNRFLTLLCEKSGLRSFEEFWEKYFESAGTAMTTAQFMELMHTYCLLSRQHTDPTALEEDGCLAREAHMAARIRDAMQTHKKVLVVAGGFHIWGLLHPQTVAVSYVLIPAEAQSVYPMRYTMPAADALSGYASGMPAPGFYAGIWQAMHEEGNPWDRVILDYLVRTGRALRRKGATISAFDETCALDQARGLADLRDKAAPGLYELQDAVLSCFVKGEASLSGLEPVEILRELVTGKTVGQLCSGALVPPLARDFDVQCKKHRLKQEAGTRQEITLAIFSNPKHRAVSRFLYQTEFLDCGFAKRKKGPDLLRRKDRNLIREIWDYRWSVSVDTALIEHSASGATMTDACAAELRQRMASANRAQEGAELLFRGFLMGISDVADKLASRMDALLVADGDFYSLCAACDALNTLEQWRSQYGETATYDYPALLRRCFERVVQMLPAQNNVDDRHVQRVQQACMLIYQVTGRDTFADQRPQLLRAFQLLVGQNPIHPGLHGAVLGLLYGADPARKEKIDLVVRGYLKGTRGMMLQSAAFLQGLFYTARDLLLVDHGFLKQIDELLCELSDEDFTALLPELRLAFSYFVPMETDRIARNAAALHGTKNLNLRREGVDPVVYARGEALDAWAAEQLRKEEITNDP